VYVCICIYIYIYKSLTHTSHIQVRAAAVSALAKFGSKIESLRPSVVALLRRCLNDDDNEVRDRATTLLRVLKREPFESYLIPGGNKDDSKNEVEVTKARTLRRRLEAYRLRPSPGLLSFDVLPEVEDEQEDDEEEDKQQQDEDDEEKVQDVKEGEKNILSDLYRVPEFAELGAVFKTCRNLKLSESEAEYVVSCDKHVFQNSIVFQFHVKNTINDCVLENVCVSMTPDEEEGWDLDNKVVIPAKVAKYNDVVSTYVMIPRTSDGDEEEDEGPPEAVFTCELTFTVKDCDENTGEALDPDDEGEEDQFPLEDVEVERTDYLTKARVSSFRKVWEKMASSDCAEKVTKVGFQGKSVAETVDEVVKYLGIATCEGTGLVDESERAHMLLMSGIYLGGVKVLVRAHVQQTKNGNGCVLKMAVRCESESVCTFVSECLA
jgi:coatomer subunit gamma